MAIVYAKTIVDGKKVGVYPFIVEIRDRKTRQLYDGVEVGDIGPKLGYNTKDNGFMRFNNYKIP